VLHRTYDTQVCSIAGALEVVGERWSLLIIRNVFLGVRRFDEIQHNLGVARNVLRDRLNLLVAEGILERRRYQERPERFEYRLTAKGYDLWPVLHSIMTWGDRHVSGPGREPTVVEHRDCGGRVDERQTCERCGEPVGSRDVVARPGPGATPGHPLLANVS
jgi:DNA-binding HxlR family transcriptional regulator